MMAEEAQCVERPYFCLLLLAEVCTVGRVELSIRVMIQGQSAHSSPAYRELQTPSYSSCSPDHSQMHASNVSPSQPSTNLPAAGWAITPTSARSATALSSTMLAPHSLATTSSLAPVPLFNTQPLPLGFSPRSPHGLLVSQSSHSDLLSSTFHISHGASPAPHLLQYSTQSNSRFHPPPSSALPPAAPTPFDHPHHAHTHDFSTSQAAEKAAAASDASHWTQHNSRFRSQPTSAFPTQSTHSLQLLERNGSPPPAPTPANSKPVVELLSDDVQGHNQDHRIDREGSMGAVFGLIGPSADLSTGGYGSYTWSNQPSGAPTAAGWDTDMGRSVKAAQSTSAAVESETVVAPKGSPSSTTSNRHPAAATDGRGGRKTAVQSGQCGAPAAS